jgi:hypothetical protein
MIPDFDVHKIVGLSRREAAEKLKKIGRAHV